MKCVIDEFGMLIIDGIEKRCPYSSKRCGTWCALFSISLGTGNRMYVDLCRKTREFWVEDFTEKPLEDNKNLLEMIIDARKVT